MRDDNANRLCTVQVVRLALTEASCKVRQCCVLVRRAASMRVPYGYVRAPWHDVCA